MRIKTWIATLSLAALALTAPAARADEHDLKTTFDQLLPGMSQEQPQQKWQELCWNAAAPGHEAERGQACKLMLEKLGPDTPAPTRMWLLKQLERIGRGESVEALAAVVSDKDKLVRDAAIRALANNPAPAAGEKLRAALGAGGDAALKVALINALGFRAEPESTEILAGELRSGNSELASAAARALGKLATPGAIAALKAALKSAHGPVRLQIGEALAICAEKLFVEADIGGARSIAELLYQPDEPVRLAGLKGMLRTSLENTADAILKVLERNDPRDISVAVGHVAVVESRGIKHLADGLASLPPAAQVALLRALGARRDRAALPAVVAAAGHADPAVKAAALAALGGVGDGSTVPLLVKAMQAGGEPASLARHSLETVFADGVDQALVDTMKKMEDRGRRALLIEILDNRRASSAVPALLEEVASDDGNVRRKAIVALGNVAGPGDVPRMVRGLFTIHDAGELNEAGWAIAAVCSRIADEAKQADPVLAEYRNAPAPEQLVLLPVLGRIGGPAALALIREAVAGADPARRASGYDALFHSPDPAVAEDLAKLAESTTNEDLKIHAIHELARVVILPGAGSDDARLALLTRGFAQARRDAEKRLILDRAREVHSFAAVKFAAAHIGEPKLASQAIATVVDLLHRDEVRQPNQAEADTILDQVIKLSKDKSLIERAKSFKSK